MSRIGPMLGCLLLAAASPSPAQPVATMPLPEQQAKHITTDVRDAMRRFAVPGAVVMAIRDGRIVYVKAFGSKESARDIPVLINTRFEIGSITKQFTAASILQLQEEGKLQIDKPLADYLPDAPYAREVTLRQLLNHTSGLHDYLDLPADQFDRLVTQPISYDDLVARIARLPLDFAPGSRWSYSNTGYLLLGKVIEVVSGEPYRAYLEQHILKPLDMTETTTTAEEPRLANVAKGYRHVDGAIEPAPIIDASWGGAAGFLVTTVGDLAKWDAALMDGRVVSPASYAEMTASSGTSDYGLGLAVGPMFGQPRIGHTGGSIGFTSADEYFPRQKTRIIAFTNLGDEAPEAGEALTNIVFADLYPGIVARARTPAAGESARVTQTVKLAFGELQAGGSYEKFNERLKGELRGELGPKFVGSLRPYGPPSAAIFQGDRVTDGQHWLDYQMYFAPGVALPFSVRIDQSGVVAGFSVG